MKTLKYSKQREAIKLFLQDRKDHPTADSVYMSIRQQYPNISLGTVYRNLSLLAEIGEIQKISCGDQADRFDGNPMPHNHFVCSSCGAVSDLEVPELLSLDQLAAKYYKGRIIGHQLYFYGYCPNCVGSKKSAEDSDTLFS